MPISTQQALDCFSSDDLIGIGMEADAVRRTLHPEGAVTYAIDAVLPCTADAVTLNAGIESALAEGATGLTLLACPADLHLLEDLLSRIKAAFPQLNLCLLSAPEVHSLASAAGLSLTDVLQSLKSAGLDALSGGAPDIAAPSHWLDAHRAAHSVGLPSTASMTFGGGETSLQCVSFLQAIHALQQETHGFQSFCLRSASAPSGRDLDDPTAIEYLKTLAICRMVLDNIPHIQSDWRQQGLKVLQMGLRFGGNDIGSILGGNTRAPEEEVRRIIRDAGFRPVQRDTLYRSVFLN